MNRFAHFLAVCILFAHTSLNAQSNTYTDCRNKTISLPLGKLAFADQIIQFKLGNPLPDLIAQANAQNALHSPDFRNDVETPYNYTCLGCGGSITLYFADNVLTDGPGNDLYIFEAGQNVESMKVEISANGVVWNLVGFVEGADMGLDIRTATTSSDEYFKYVRITDMGVNCDGFMPGADIDAVAAINSYKTLSFKSSALFEPQTPNFKDTAKEELNILGQAFNKHKPCTLKINMLKLPTETDALMAERTEVIKSYLLDYIDDPESIKVQILTDEKLTISQNLNKYSADIDVFFLKGVLEK